MIKLQVQTTDKRNEISCVDTGNDALYDNLSKPKLIFQTVRYLWMLLNAWIFDLETITLRELAQPMDRIQETICFQLSLCIGYITAPLLCCW